MSTTESPGEASARPSAGAVIGRRPFATRPTPRVLSIAGTDPTGGAGVQADLKSIAANGGYGMAVVTALVAQNTRGVRSVHTPPVGFLREQLDAVADDVVIDAVKIGMLGDARIIEAVATWLRETTTGPVVLDPVMVATSGDRLLRQDAEAAMRELLPLVDLVTPNLPELAVLAEQPEASTWEQALVQAQGLAARHEVLVLAKGGHLSGPDSPDALVGPEGVLATLPGARIATRNTHGTGCSLSSAIATLRGRGEDWAGAVRGAKDWLAGAIAAADSLEVGRGSGPVSHFAALWEAAGTHAPAATTIAEEWWEAAAELRTQIDALPVVRGLADGTLPRPVFHRYLAQDAIYLQEYSRALAAASTLAPSAEEQAFWAGAAQGAIAAETELHAGRLGPEELFAAQPDATTRAYVDHLLALAARGRYEELAAALLPCFWIYDDVGARLSRAGTAGHPYGDWLATYGDPDFHAETLRAIELVTACAARASSEVRAAMRTAFLVSVRHERDFFAAPLGGGR